MRSARSAGSSRGRADKKTTGTEAASAAPLQGEADEHAWVTLEEAKQYQLIDGILDELAMAEKKRLGHKMEWKRMKN